MFSKLLVCRRFFTDDLLRRSVSEFARSVILPKVPQMDAAGVMDPQIIAGLFEQGFMGVEIPEQFGGAGLSFTDSIVVIEELAKIDPSVAALADIHNTLLNRALLKFGSTEQKEKWLPLLASGTVGSFAISESAAGSDAFGGMRTSAVLMDEETFVINGEKAWISNSRDGAEGMLLVFAKSSANQISAFLIDRNASGVTVGKKEDKLGIRASSTCVVSFADVKVNKREGLLGTAGGGSKIAIGLLNEGRIGIAAQMLGLARGSFDVGMKYMLTRSQFGQPIAEFQGLKHQYAQVYTEIQAAHGLVYAATELKERADRGEISEKDFIKEASMAKLFASQTAEKTASKVIEWMGGVGFTKEFPAEKFYRDAKIGAIYEGTSNVQLDTIAKQLIKEYM